MRLRRMKRSPPSLRRGGQALPALQDRISSLYNFLLSTLHTLPCPGIG